MSNKLRAWMERATPEQKRVLANLAGTTTANLHQASKGYRTGGKLRITPDLARRLEFASREIEGMPPLYREDLSPPCAGCEFAAKCRGKI